MRLLKITIKNYRCFKNQEIAIDRYSCFVGPNGAGKSTVLMALNIFFRNSEAPSDVVNLQEEDFHNRDTSQPIEIICIFEELSELAKEDLKAYARHGQLAVTVKAEWNPTSLRAEVKQYGIRKIMNDFVPYFQAEEAKALAAELKGIYAGIRSSFPELPLVTTKDAMRSALREYEENNLELCEDIESPTQFYGWSKGANLLKKHISWVYLPAVKDPTEEQDEQRNSALGNLLQRTIRSEIDFAEPIEALRQQTNSQYLKLISDQDLVLKDVSEKIQSQLKNWSHSGAKVELAWHFDDQKSVSLASPYARAKIGEGDFLGELVRSGHGMQRSFLIALLRVLATTGEGDLPTLLLGFEEPELYQHPPQAKHLASLLEILSTHDSQIIITTHSPYFVSSRGYENIRLVRTRPTIKGSSVSQVKYTDLADMLSQALGDQPQKPTEVMAAVEQIMQPSQSELFFCTIPVLVEGAEDVAFISTYLRCTDQWDEFRRLGCHFVVCDGKTNMSRPLAIAKGLGLPTFTVFDGDCDRKDSLNNQIRDNQCLLNLLSSSLEPIQETNILENNFVMWKTRIMDEIIQETGDANWDTHEKAARNKFILNNGVRRKNPLVVTATVEMLLAEGFSMTLLKLASKQLMKYARSVK
ncbi:MAG: AAA family ATPase [Candidatus Marinimicrobia bacterium]|nr:AAA family ATPase [Candidatus Neomarinimicrobiota bacterium]